MSGPADPGLQPERTALAWRRTSLALIALSLGSARVTWQFLGPWALALAAVGAGLGVWLALYEGRRYERHSTLLRTGEGVADGLAPALTAGLTVMIGIAALITALSGVPILGR